jgi:competence protein ComFC
VKASTGSGLGRLGKLFELLFYPTACRICSNILEKPGERVICGACLASVGPDERPFCLHCGRFFDTDEEPHACSSCLENRPAYSYHRSYGRYDGVLRDLLLVYKYRRVAVLGKILAGHICRSPGSTEELWAGVDLVIPVPLHPRRRRERGFNQSELLARFLSSPRGVRISTKSLVKIENNPPQTSLEAASREGNVKGVYRVRKNEDFENRVVLVVDDVFTTGATLAECSRVLIGGGAAEVRGLTIAQA